jgi:hypothetical protein
MIKINIYKNNIKYLNKKVIKNNKLLMILINKFNNYNKYNK